MISNFVITYLQRVILRITYYNRVVAVENIPGETLITAMNEFRDGTDWSGWKRRDWEAAYATLIN